MPSSSRLNSPRKITVLFDPEDELKINMKNEAVQELFLLLEPVNKKL